MRLRRRAEIAATLPPGGGRAKIVRSYDQEDRAVKWIMTPLVALALAAAAVAANPTKNGLYSGKLNAPGLEKKVELHVAKSGKTATAALLCSKTRSGRIPTFPITKGSFNAKDKFNTFGVKGRFTSAASAATVVHLEGICDRAAPGNFKVTMRLSGR